MKTKLLSIAMMVALILAAITRGQAQEYDGPCLPPTHGLDDHQSAFCGSTETQTIALLTGANWFSTYLDITLEDLQAALVAASTPNKTITIKSHGANATYSRGRWNVPAAFTWDVANRFVIVLDEDIEISLEGMPIDPAEHPITIVGNGVSNWIGFPFSQSMTITEAFATLPPQNNDNVKDPSGNSVYNRGRWQGTTFTTLVPGHGYIFVSAPNSTDRVFTFPSSNK